MMLRVAFCLMLLGPCMHAREVEVRLWSLFSLSQVTVTPSGNDLQWRRCATCIAKPALSHGTVRARGDRVLYGGASAGELRFSGAYRLGSDRAGNVSPAFPLRVRARGGWLLLTIRMPLEEYVAAVLNSETAASDPDEALKAMAVAVRTYAVRFALRHRSEGFDFCDSTHCQFMRLGTVERVRRAMEETRGQLLWFGGKPARTYFHQDCGGTTAAAQELWPDVKSPYLAEHPDPYCVISSGVRWQSDLSRKEVEQALTAAGVHLPFGWNLVIATRWHSGRVRRLRLGTATASPLISASTFRFAVGRALGWQRVRSDWYDLEVRGASFHLNGRGSGHGVGLCQFGASEMAREGRGYGEILAFYYPGTELGARPPQTQAKLHQGITVDVEARDFEAADLIAAAERAHSEARTRSGLLSAARPLVHAYATVEQFRNATGEPGWVAASTRGNVIRLQPVSLLKSRHTLETTLRHEFLHMLVESNRRATLPLWFREGLVLYLENGDAREATDMRPAQINRALARRSSPAMMRKAYAAARSSVERLASHYGESEVIRWLHNGIPASALSLIDRRSDQASSGAQN